jgi:pyrroline-5-carboxylate reductase
VQILKEDNMIGFIGGGNMGEAIIKGLIQSNVYLL